MRLWLGLPNLTVTSLCYSGIINMARELIEEKGELDNQDYTFICDTFNYGRPIYKKTIGKISYTAYIGKLKEFIMSNV